VPPGGARICGISGFGLSGTNAHLVLEQAPVVAPEPPSGADRPEHLLTISARDPAALRQLAARYGALLQGGAALPDVAFSAHTTRLGMPHRLAITADSADQAVTRLAGFASAGEASGAATGTASGRRPRVAFLFSGQGSQYPGMGRALYEGHPVYRDAIDRCAAILDGLLDRSLLEILHSAPDDDTVHDTTYTQPALFAVEYALATLWQRWGVQPDVVIGHSIGELVAACVAGVFSLEDGLRLVAERGRQMGALPREGAMVALFADGEVVTAALAPHGEAVGIAAINNPGETVISGQADAVMAVAAALAEQGIEHRALTVSHAFHSALMEPMLDGFEAVARDLTMSAPQIPLVSNLSGALSGAEITDPAYWRRQVREAVRFADGLRTLDEQGIDVFVEIGPHSALLGMGQRTLERRGVAWLPSLRRKDPPWATLLGSVGQAWARGVHVDWVGWDAPWSRQRVRLPTYPWQRRRTWLSDDEWPGQQTARDDWLVQVDWTPSPAASSARPDGHWVVIGGGSIAQEVTSALNRLGAYASAEDDPSRVQRDDLGGVIFLGALGLSVDPGQAVDAAWQAVEVVQALAAQGAEVPVAWVTSGAVSASEVVHPAQAVLSGLARVVRLEHPELRSVHVDLDPAQGVDADALVAAILADDGEPEVALRAERWVPRLQSADAPALPIELSPEGGYLITGGLGGLGLALAEWLVAHGARRLYLTSRRARDEAAPVLEALRQAGATPEVVLGDVGVPEDVDRILARIAEDGPLVGVFHLAGVLADGMLLNQQAEGFAVPFGPKLAGTWNLHRALPDTLEFLVLFSGGASMMGAPGQGNYAGANSWLDAFAHHRNALGHRTLAVNWGAWAEVGMAASLGEEHATRQARMGVGSLPLQAGLDLLGRLLAADHAQVGVLPVDWDRFVSAAHAGVVPAFLERLASSPAAPDRASGQGPTETVGSALPLVQALGAPDRAAAVDAFVHAVTLRVLDFDRSRQLDRDRPLLEMGLDSLLAVQLKNDIMDGGVDVPVAKVITGPSITRINALVLAEMDQMEVGVGAAGGVTPRSGGAVPVQVISPIVLVIVAVIATSMAWPLAYLTAQYFSQPPVEQAEAPPPEDQVKEPAPEKPARRKRGRGDRGGGEPSEARPEAEGKREKK